MDAYLQATSRTHIPCLKNARVDPWGLMRATHRCSSTFVWKKNMNNMSNPKKYVLLSMTIFQTSRERSVYPFPYGPGGFLHPTCKAWSRSSDSIGLLSCTFHASKRLRSSSGSMETAWRREIPRWLMISTTKTWLNVWNYNDWFSEPQPVGNPEDEFGKLMKARKQKGTKPNQPGFFPLLTWIRNGFLEIQLISMAASIWCEHLIWARLHSACYQRMRINVDPLNNILRPLRV